ncbi:hypothetical protein Tco_1007899 [Tanacetum coccineum]
MNLRRFRGELPVKYLEVPLISSRLLNKDCKILVEKARNRIRDWKNKSLSFAGRLQLSNYSVVFFGVTRITNVVRRKWHGLAFDFPNGKEALALLTRGPGCINEELQLVIEYEIGDGRKILSTYETVSYGLPREGYSPLEQMWLSSLDAMEFWNWPPTCLRVRNYDREAMKFCGFIRCGFHIVFRVWNYVRMYAGMENVSPHLDDVLLWCQSLSTKRTFKGVVGKLIFAATSYFIWMERNARLFKNVKRPSEDIRDLILVTVRLKLHTFKFNNTTKIRRLLSLWKMPNSLRFYD